MPVSDALLVGEDWISEHYFTTDATKESFQGRVMDRRKTWDGVEEGESTTRSRFTSARAELESRLVALSEASGEGGEAALSDQLLSVLGYTTGQWRLTPTDAHDDVVNQAFSGHQQQRARLGPWAPATLHKLACQAGASVVTSVSQWNLMAPKHHVFLSRFLSERIQAAVEHEPEQAILANEWLQRRLEQATKELTVEVEHVDVLVDALGTPRHGRPTTCDG